jgi:hypothetical protein
VLANEVDRPDESKALLERGIEIARTRGDRQGLTWFGAALTIHHIGSGDWDDGFALSTDTLPEGILRGGNMLAAALFLAKASFERGDDHAARGWLDRMSGDVADSVDLQNANMAPLGDALRAFLDGKLSAGLDCLTRAWHLSAAVDRWEPAIFALAWGIDGAMVLGDPGAAAPLAELYDRVPSASLTRVMRAIGGRLRARRAILEGAEDAAADAFAEALAAARSDGRRGQLAPVLADYGAWLVECGRGAEAEPLLDEAFGVFEQMRAQRWLDRIEALRAKAAVTV